MPEERIEGKAAGGVDPNDPTSWPPARLAAALAALESAKTLTFNTADLVAKARLLLHADPSAAWDGLLVFVTRAIDALDAQGLPPAAAMVDEAFALAKAAPPLPANVGFVESCKPVLRSLQFK